MQRRWIDVDSDGEATAKAVEFWSSMRSDLVSGEFWTDRISKCRGEPAKALKIAIGQLPLPAAFRTAAVSLRALIRARRKSRESFENELVLLYWLAAIRSFILEYAPRLKEPGFNIVERIPGRNLCSLPFSYSELGYRELSLLNKTDVKWLTEAWGEPVSHSTLNALYRNVWEAYESMLISRRIEERQNMIHQFFPKAKSKRAP